MTTSPRVRIVPVKSIDSEKTTNTFEKDEIETTDLVENNGG
jgi:hypothetical protein